MRRGLQCTQCLNRNQHAYAVIHRFGDKAISHFCEQAVERGDIADLHGTVLLARRANVNIDFIQRRRFVHFFKAIIPNDACYAIQKADAPSQHIPAKHTPDG